MISEEKGTALLFEMLYFFIKQLFAHVKMLCETGEAHVAFCAPVYHFFVKCNILRAQKGIALYAFFFVHFSALHCCFLML